MIDHEVGRAKCRQKTACGNRFDGRRAAKQAAANKRRETGDDIQPFRCNYCPYYHIGGRRREAERKARTVAERERQAS